MADFRKWILALAVLAMFAGLASAQSSNPFTCSAQAAVTPQLRSEGLTELVGDILLTCQGGTPLPPGSQIPTANITVYMNGTVTSRLLPNTNNGNASEALLLIDEPGNGGAVYGNTVPQTPCTVGGALVPSQGAGTNGCTQFVGSQGTAPTNFGALSATNNLGVPVSGAANVGTPGAHVFQGIVSGGSVTFFGVPVQPPVTGSTIRTYRITNIRVNANGITGGGPIPANAVAALAISGSTSIPIANPTLTVGFISQSLNASMNKAFSTSGSGSSGVTFNQCQSQPGGGSTPVPAGTMRFTELQGSAFKMRGPVTTSGTAIANSAQNIPGQIYSDESGFVAPYLTSANSGTNSTAIAGLADWGTRLKAVFNNIPSGVSIFVSTSNIVNATNVPATAVAGSSFASLVVSETSPDSAANPPASWNGTSQTPIVGTNTGLPLVSQVGTSSGVGYAPLTIVNGSASAVWEVVNSLPNAIENFDFEVFITYTANTASNLPPAPSTMNVNLSYAPIPTQGAFTLSAGGAASSTLGIPRFADTSAAKAVLNIAICQTALLYPYVINTNGFDTGLAVANTTQDPFGTAAQSGYCSVYWYGSTAPSTNPGFLGNAGYQTTTPTSSQLIAAGTIQAWGASVVAPGFSGYVIAVCNFQYAHGFAFVSDLGARNLAMGYLADVMGSGGLSRGPSPSEPYGQ